VLRTDGRTELLNRYRALNSMHADARYKSTSVLFLLYTFNFHFRFISFH